MTRRSVTMAVIRLAGVTSNAGLSVRVPAVFSDAVFYAMVDSFYPSEEAVYRWTRERTFQASRSSLMAWVSVSLTKLPP